MVKQYLAFGALLVVVGCNSILGNADGEYVAASASSASSASSGDSTSSSGGANGPGGAGGAGGAVSSTASGYGGAGGYASGSGGTPSMCAANESNCDGSCVDTSIDTSNCGSCGTVCTAPDHATPGCALGVCGIGECDENFGDCDLDGTTGCESELATDLSNCGSCGNACGATSLCTMGSCEVCALNLLAKIDVTTGLGPQLHATAHFDGDGKLDLVTANWGNAGAGNSVSILLGNGDGTFKAKTDLTTGTGPYDVIAADLNGDGTMDVAAANFGANSISVLLGNGDGSFGAKADYVVGQAPAQLAAIDVDGDNKLDVVTANFTDSTISVLLGKGDGTFGGKSDYSAGLGSRAIVAADFNGDGNVDLAAANYGSTGSGNTVSVLLGNGDGSFKTKNDFVVGAGPIDLVHGDFDSDGNIDLAIANYGKPGAHGTTASILLGNGDGSFKSKSDYTTGTGPAGLIGADINGDGHLDLGVANFANGAGTSVSILLGVGNGAFEPKLDVTVGTGPRSIAFDDVNGDGKLDVTTPNRGAGSGNTVSVLLNGACLP